MTFIFMNSGQYETNHIAHFDNLFANKAGRGGKHYFKTIQMHLLFKSMNDLFKKKELLEK